MLIRSASLEEVRRAVEWADQEGWEPGLTDAEPFHAADPEGFFAAEVDDLSDPRLAEDKEPVPRAGDRPASSNSASAASRSRWAAAAPGPPFRAAARSCLAHAPGPAGVSDHSRHSTSAAAPPASMRRAAPAIRRWAASTARTAG